MTKQEYATRRDMLQKEVQLPIALTAHQEMQAKADMAYPFTQETSFLYLTGINDANWVLFWDLKQWHLVRPEVSEVHALFDGSLSSEEASTVSGIESILTAEEFASALEKTAKTNNSIATLGVDPHQEYYDFSMNPSVEALSAKLSIIFDSVEDCRPVLRKLRATKTDLELHDQRQAINVTVEAFSDIKNRLNSLKYEYEIEAHLSQQFRVKGTAGHAYSPIVAAGEHACTLHYAKNQSPLPKNGLVLIDAGTHFGGYAADITRTYAIGVPTERQVAVHSAVEAAHVKIIDLIKPGVSFASYQKTVDEIMKDALLSIGLLKEVTDEKTYRKYFPHAISHGLGLDVHESLGGYKEFQPGMVLTVEPGIYIPEEGIGVRIEDDILVTADGNENLSGHLATSL